MALEEAVVGGPVGQVHDCLHVGTFGYLTSLDCSLDHQSMLIAQRSHHSLGPGAGELFVELGLGDESHERTTHGRIDDGIRPKGEGLLEISFEGARVDRWLHGQKSNEKRIKSQ